MATHSSVLAWGIPGMAEPGELPSLGSHTLRASQLLGLGQTVLQLLGKSVLQLYFI